MKYKLTEITDDYIVVMGKTHSSVGLKINNLTLNKMVNQLLIENKPITIDNLKGGDIVYCSDGIFIDI